MQHDDLIELSDLREQRELADYLTAEYDAAMAEADRLDDGSGLTHFDRVVALAKAEGLRAAAQREYDALTAMYARRYGQQYEGERAALR